MINTLAIIISSSALVISIAALIVALRKHAVPRELKEALYLVERALVSINVALDKARKAKELQ